jgi:NADH-quinone oxidoreductase subunit E
MSAMTSSLARTTTAEDPIGDAVLVSVDEVLERYRYDRTALIAILLDVQDILGYLPVIALKRIGSSLDVPATQIYGIATFYKHFRLRPPGHHQLTVCTGTACHVRGAAQVMREFERRLGIGAGEVTADQEYGLETVHCVGACALGPVVIVDDQYKGQMTALKIPVLLRRLQHRARIEVPV